MRPKHGHLGVLKRNIYLYLRWQHLDVIDKMRNHDIRKALNQTRLSQMYMIPDQWFGHVLRMDTNRIENITLHGRVEGTLKRGRPRIMWMTSVLAWTTASNENCTNKRLMLTHARAYTVLINNYYISLCILITPQMLFFSSSFPSLFL